jgi:recombination protein RecT
MMEKKMSNQTPAEKKNIMLTNQKSVVGLLEQMKGEIARCLPKHLTTERMTRIAITELRKTPKLQECEPMSFIAAIMQASQLGLEPGVLGSCYLIPFYNNRTGKTECTFMPGYRGFLDLARRSGQIVSLVARSVYANDYFHYEFGLDEQLIHRPALDDRGELTLVYAVAKLKDGGHQFDVMSRQEVEVIRSTSKSKDNGPWVTNYDEMAKKTILRRLFKWLPCSVEMQKAVSLDEQQETGIQNIKASASEDFDIDFITDDEMPPKSTKSDALAGKIKAAKGKVIEAESFTETGELATTEQLEDIHAWLSVKKVEHGYLPAALKEYGVEKLADLTVGQAENLKTNLSKFPDKE